MKEPRVTLESYLKLLRKAQRRIVAETWFDDLWVCKAGLWPEAAAPRATVFKLHKRHWSPDSQAAAGNTMGNHDDWNRFLRVAKICLLVGILLVVVLSMFAKVLGLP